MTVSNRPNILLILTDQHRLSAVGSYGETPCQTPNLDRLASEGVRFETAYTVCPVCSPARATVMTGLYPHAHGICSNIHNLGSSIHELADRPELLSRRLNAAGYRCGYTGKWHLGEDAGTAFGAPVQPSLPRDVGFEGQNFPGHGGGGFRYPEYRSYLAERGYRHQVTRTREPARYGILSGPVESTVPYFLTEHTIGLMQAFSRTEQPFFIWHNFWGPHGPYYAPQEFYDLYRDVEIPEWPNYCWEARATNGPHQVKIHPDAEKLSWDDWAEWIRHYYAFTTLIDRQIGRLLDHLERTGLAENTLVLFTSDHGETLGSHGGLEDKGWHHFEEIQRIPFMVRMPAKGDLGALPPGAVLQEWISLADVYPTLLDVAGCDHDPSVLHGRSLLPLFNGEQIRWRDAAFVEFNGVNGLATSMGSVRKGSIKYGWNCSNRDELYDLAWDPHEMHNRVDDEAYQDILREMRQRLADWMLETNYDPRARNMYHRSRMSL